MHYSGKALKWSTSWQNIPSCAKSYSTSLAWNPCWSPRSSEERCGPWGKLTFWFASRSNASNGSRATYLLRSWWVSLLVSRRTSSSWWKMCWREKQNGWEWRGLAGGRIMAEDSFQGWCRENEEREREREREGGGWGEKNRRVERERRNGRAERKILQNGIEKRK